MYEPKKFDIPELKGISKQTIEEHLKLYEGYVKNTNLILEKISSGEGYDTSEMRRRLGFEFDGMRNHEYYFEQLEGGPKNPIDGCTCNAQIERQWGSRDAWLEELKNVAKTRGVGWAITYYDKKADKLIDAWVDEQQFGHLTGLDFMFGIDMWEHSFMLDYPPSEKAKYIDAYLENVNWQVMGGRFTESSGR